MGKLLLVGPQGEPPWDGHGGCPVGLRWLCLGGVPCSQADELGGSIWGLEMLSCTVTYRRKPQVLPAGHLCSMQLGQEVHGVGFVGTGMHLISCTHLQGAGIQPAHQV